MAVGDGARGRPPAPTRGGVAAALALLLAWGGLAAAHGKGPVWAPPARVLTLGAAPDTFYPVVAQGGRDYGVVASGSTLRLVVGGRGRWHSDRIGAGGFSGPQGEGALALTVADGVAYVPYVDGQRALDLAWDPWGPSHRWRQGTVVPASGGQPGCGPGDNPFAPAAAVVGAQLVIAFAAAPACTAAGSTHGTDVYVAAAAIASLRRGAWRWSVTPVTAGYPEDGLFPALAADGAAADLAYQDSAGDIAFVRGTPTAHGFRWPARPQLVVALGVQRRMDRPKMTLAAAGGADVLALYTGGNSGDVVAAIGAGGVWRAQTLYRATAAGSQRPSAALGTCGPQVAYEANPASSAGADRVAVATFAAGRWRSAAVGAPEPSEVAMWPALAVTPGGVDLLSLYDASGAAALFTTRLACGAGAPLAGTPAVAAAGPHPLLHGGGVSGASAAAPPSGVIVDPQIPFLEPPAWAQGCIKGCAALVASFSALDIGPPAPLVSAAPGTGADSAWGVTLTALAFGPRVCSQLTVPGHLGAPGGGTSSECVAPPPAVDIGFRGTVVWSSSDPALPLPPPHAFTAADGGSHTFPLDLPPASALATPLTLTAQSSAGGVPLRVSVTLVRLEGRIAPAGGGDSTVNGFVSCESTSYEQYPLLRQEVAQFVAPVGADNAFTLLLPYDQYACQLHDAAPWIPPGSPTAAAMRPVGPSTVTIPVSLQAPPPSAAAGAVSSGTQGAAAAATASPPPCFGLPSSAWNQFVCTLGTSIVKAGAAAADVYQWLGPQADGADGCMQTSTFSPIQTFTLGVPIPVPSRSFPFVQVIHAVVPVGSAVDWSLSHRCVQDLEKLDADVASAEGQALSAIGAPAGWLISISGGIKETDLAALDAIGGNRGVTLHFTDDNVALAHALATYQARRGRSLQALLQSGAIVLVQRTDPTNPLPGLSINPLSTAVDAMLAAQGMPGSQDPGSVAGVATRVVWAATCPLLTFVSGLGGGALPLLGLVPCTSNVPVFVTPGEG